MHGLGKSITIIVTVDCHATIQQQRLIFLNENLSILLLNIGMMGIVHGNNRCSV